MANITTFECKKAFRQSANTGTTFHWLKSTYSDCLDRAVNEAIRIVYYPSAVAFFTNGADRSRVIDSLNHSRRTFDRWMNFAQEMTPIAKESPNRVLVEFALTVDDSEAGVALDWLLTQGDRVEKKILDAVLLLYFPVALWAFHHPDRRLAIMRSLTLFYNWMDLPGYPTPIDTFEFTKSPRYLAVPGDSVFETLRNDRSLAVEDSPSESLTNPDEAEEPDEIADSDEGEKPDNTPEIDLDFDF